MIIKVKNIKMVYYRLKIFFILVKIIWFWKVVLWVESIKCMWNMLKMCSCGFEKKIGWWNLWFVVYKFVI